MSPQEAEKIIREACIKANPSILELGFGCEVIYMPDQTKCIYLNGSMEGYLALWNAHGPYRDEGKFYKILGREPRLSDVLLAINSCPSWAEIWLISSAGHIFKSEWIGQGDWGLKKREGMGDPFWDMSKDSLADQSDETKIFLAGLLSEKK